MMFLLGRHFDYQALRFGNADIGFLEEGGPAWIGWQEYGLSVLAVETTTSSGATHCNASAWVLNGSDIAEAHLDGNDSTDPFAMLQGKTSCHTGWLKSAGMLMPMELSNRRTIMLLQLETLATSALSGTLSTITSMVQQSIGNPASIPDSGALYSGYSGALECLRASELR